MFDRDSHELAMYAVERIVGTSSCICDAAKPALDYLAARRDCDRGDDCDCRESLDAEKTIRCICPTATVYTEVARYVDLFAARKHAVRIAYAVYGSTLSRQHYTPAKRRRMLSDFLEHTATVRIVDTVHGDRCSLLPDDSPLWPRQRDLKRPRSLLRPSGILRSPFPYLLPPWPDNEYVLVEDRFPGSRSPVPLWTDDETTVALIVYEKNSEARQDGSGKTYVAYRINRRTEGWTKVPALTPAQAEKAAQEKAEKKKKTRRRRKTTKAAA